MEKTGHFFLLIFLLFAFASSLLAQDAAAPIRRGSPSPAAEAPPPEATPSQPPAPVAPPAQAPPAPTEAPTPPPEIQTEATPAPQKPEGGTKSAGKVIKEEPARATEPRASSTRRRAASPPAEPRRAWKPTFDVSDEAGWGTGSGIRAAENKWQKAIQDHDVETIEKLLSNNFVATSSAGKVASKSTLLSEIRKDQNVYETSSTRGMFVRSIAPGVAVVTGIATEAGTTKTGKRFKNTRRFTDTWHERNGSWQCVASQATQVPKR